jgi:glycosyltransferase involved in cell wall biosynthesis
VTHFCAVGQYDMPLAGLDSSKAICAGALVTRETATGGEGVDHSSPALVSVVIPTLNRPVMLKRALDSVFRQTWQNLEIIVVVDGPDAETITMLKTIENSRLTVIINPKSLTAAGARNAGLDRARGEWIAFLDDDDEWRPDKLAKQLHHAADCGAALITCLSEVVTAESSYISPKVIYDKGAPIDEYLFDRRSPFAHYGFIQTSSYLLPRDLCEQIRFRCDNPHDDWDFLIRLANQFHIPVETVPEVLVTLHVDEPRQSLSKAGTWLESLKWAERMRPLMTPRAYSGFCLSAVASRAAGERAYGAAVLLLYHAFRYGSPRFWRVAGFVVLWLLPRSAFARLLQTFKHLKEGMGQTSARSA